MLPRHARMRRSEDFRRTVRHGVRAGRRFVVVHVFQSGTMTDGPTGASSPSTGTQPAVVGFVVSKSVGSAVRRNRVRRRLRHLALEHLGRLADDTLVVVRALPGAATAGPQLRTDLDAAWTAALAKLPR